MGIVKTKKIKKRLLPGSVAQLIDKNVPVYRENDIIQDIINSLLANARTFDSINYLYVVDQKLRLKGVFSIKELLRAPKNKQVKRIMKKRLITASPDASDEDVALLALRHNLKSVPIIDGRKHLIGAYDSDELLEVLDRKISKSFLSISGVGSFQSESISKVSAFKLARVRLPWIITGIFGGIVSAIIINAFRQTLDSVVLLVLLLPLILGLGANIANQSAMIFIRNLMSSDVKNAFAYLIKELQTSIIIAIIVSAVVGVLSYLLLGSVFVVLVAILSSLLIVVISAMVGVSVPLVLNYLRVDPATGSGPFLTIVKDIIVIFIYFSVATLLISFF